jgi:hypothetical protein
MGSGALYGYGSRRLPFGVADQLAVTETVR